MIKVLYIEDDEAMQRLYQFGLAQEGFLVTVAPTAGVALSLLNVEDNPTNADNNAYDIILLDLMLKGMSGADFLNSAKAKLDNTQTKVVVFTNIDNPNIKSRLESYNIAGFLNKSSYEPLKLAEYLKQLLAQPAA